MERFGTIVLGLGAMGSAALYHLARRGHRVLGIDRFAPPHPHGSSHGDTRITRLAIGEGVHYTPLAIRSHELWRELERESGRMLLTCNGGLVISSEAKSSKTHVDGFLANTVAAARTYGIAHETLVASDIRRRFPPFRVADDEVGYFEPGAGFVRPEACVAAHLDCARSRGASVRVSEAATSFDADSRGVSVATERSTYAANRLIIAAGAWLPELLATPLARHFKIHRQVMFWFDVEASIASFVPERFPIFIWELQGRSQGIYGFPAIDGPQGGIKIATEAFSSSTSADTVDKAVGRDEIDATYERYVAPFVSGVNARCLKAATCLYTVTADFGFVIDVHPHSERVLIASPCSGHGFKHSPAIGEALAEWAIEGATRLDLAAFALGRFDGCAA